MQQDGRGAKQKQRDWTQTLRSPWSDCGKRERVSDSMCERARGEEGEGGGDWVRKGIRRQDSKDRPNKGEESLSGPWQGAPSHF